MLYWTILIVGAFIVAALIQMMRKETTPGSWLVVVAVAGGVLWLASLADTPAVEPQPGFDTQATSVPPASYQELPPPTEDYEQPAAPR